MDTSNRLSRKCIASTLAPRQPATPGAPALATQDVADWYDGGARIAYDPALHTLGETAAPWRVFVRHEGPTEHAVTFLPGFPDGSSCWAKVRPHLPAANEMPKLFVEYLGMGDSDTPDASYRYSTAERTDLVEALWRHLGVQSTTVVAFDFSSLVILEHLRRRLDRARAGQPQGGPLLRGVLIFNGGLYTDGHSHPWWTTPLLSQPGGWMGPALAAVSMRLFMLMGGAMWSPRFGGRLEAGRRVRASLQRRGGMRYLDRAAGFVAEHRAQGERLDFGALYDAWHRQVPFLVGGSIEDVFEPRQVDLAERRLGARGLQVERLPGGHMTTDEQPAALGALIARFEHEQERRDGA